MPLAFLLNSLNIDPHRRAVTAFAEAAAARSYRSLTEVLKLRRTGAMKFRRLTNRRESIANPRLSQWDIPGTVNEAFASVLLRGAPWNRARITRALSSLAAPPIAFPALEMG